jgi:hypothetical protein
MGAGGITDEHAGSQMDNLCAVLYHLFTCIFYIAAGTTVAGCKTNEFETGVRVYAESPFLVPHRPEALPARAATVAIADHDSNLCL